MSKSHPSLMEQVRQAGAVEDLGFSASEAAIIRLDDLPRLGSSWNFVGRDHGDVPLSFYVVEMAPGHGAPLHIHSYDEIILVQSGISRIVVGDTVREAGPASVIVIKAGTPHGFVNAGTEPLTQIDIHASGMFQQTNLPPSSVSRAAGLPEVGPA